MKLSFIGNNTLAGVEADARFAAEHGFEGIEYNWWGDFKDVTPELIANMRATHERHGVRASMLGIWGWNHLDRDPAKRSEAHAMLVRAIEYAKVLRADVLVTGGGELSGASRDENVAEFLRVFPPLMEQVRAAGLKPAFYSMHPASFFDSIEAFEQVWPTMPDAAIKFDAANWLGRQIDYVDVLHRFGHKVGHVHIKEWMHDGKGKLIAEPAAGMGDIAWGKVLGCLYEHDYRGWLSLEPHGSIWSMSPMREKMLLLSKQHLSQFLI
jgi:sugar phosphate isomerase/epimerase